MILRFTRILYNTVLLVQFYKPQKQEQKNIKVLINYLTAENVFAILTLQARWHCDTGSYCSFYASVFCLIWTFVVSDLSQVLKQNNFPPECAPGLLFELKCLCDMRQTLCF